MTTMKITTDADLIGALASGELWSVSEGAARRVVSAEWLALTDREVEDQGREWIYVRAESSADALAVADAYDRSREVSLRDMAREEIVAVVADIHDLITEAGT